MKKVFLLVSSLLILLTSCSRSNDQEDKEKQTAYINIGVEPTTLDPRKVRDLSSTSLCKMLFEGLTRSNSEGESELALAKEMDVSEDGRKYTFQLRESYWSDGKKVVAQDFIRAWKDILDPQFPSSMAFQLYVLKNGKQVKKGELSSDELGVKAIGEDILEVELEYPIPYFTNLLSFPTFFPIPSVVQDEKNFVCNGPFILTWWVHNDSLELRKNANYWDEKAVLLKKISMCMVDNSTELNMFEKEELDWAGSPFSTIPLDSLETLKKEKRLHFSPNLATCFYRINVEREPFTNQKMRKAFSLAIDRHTIIDHVTAKTQSPTHCFVPAVMGLGNEGYTEEYNIEKAQQLFAIALKEMGIAREQFPEIRLLYGSGERAHLIGQAIQQQLFETFGVHVKLEAVERKVLFSRVSQQDYQLAYSDFFADFEDPISFLEVFKYKNASTNNTQWENADYAHLLDRAQMCIDRKERCALLSQSEKILIDEMPFIPIFNYNMLYLKKENLKGVILSPSGVIDFKWAYVD